MSMNRMLASITSNPGAVVKIKKNIKIKKLKLLKLKANTTYCRFQTNSTVPQILISREIQIKMFSQVYIHL